ncbi:MAG: hypothetical protein KatS3mg108_2468 [Isosphaeraceae bacterium]|jgi:ABC-2 type transport system permease protein|nr:MAG: hypothetical protein KatS3mg108_2468 [Isosphaeraceae bacterium]
MPIFDQGYQHWTGRLASHGARWWAITRQGLRTQLRNRHTKYLVVSAWVPALILAAFLALWGLLEQKSAVLEPFMFLFQWLPEPIKQGPKAYRTTIWTIAFHWFLWIEVGVAMLLVLLVGSDLISQDLRFNAIPLYLSRPMRRLDYFAGKLGVIAAFLAAVMVVPVLLAYTIGVAFSLDLTVIPDTGRILLGAVLYGLLVALVCGLVMLALSSLSRNSRLVAMMWAGLWLISGMISQSVGSSLRHQDQRRPWEIISFTHNLHRVRQALLDTEAAHRQLQDLLTQAQKAAEAAASGELPGGLSSLPPPSQPRGPLARLFRPRRPPTHPELTQRIRSSAVEQNETLRNLLVSPYPWTWSAAVLGGLSLASIGVLSTRVRSLDRLK